MKLEDFDYNLPEELIAQTPLKERDSSKLLVLSTILDKITKSLLFSRIILLNSILFSPPFNFILMFFISLGSFHLLFL